LAIERHTATEETGFCGSSREVLLRWLGAGSGEAMGAVHITLDPLKRSVRPLDGRPVFVVTPVTGGGEHKLHLTSVLVPRNAAGPLTSQQLTVTKSSSRA